MTVSSVVTPRVQYAGSGSTGPFSVTYPFSVAGDLEVIKTDSSGVNTTLVLTTDYTVSGGGTPPTTGSVTLVVALAVGETLTIRRNTSKTQGTDYIENDSFPAEVHEGALDKLTLITQELEEVSGRSIVLSSTSTLSGVEFPGPGADQFIKWNAAGTALETTALSGLGAVTAGTGLTLASNVMSYTGELDDNSDVTITAASKGDILVFNGTAWVDLTVGSDTHILTADSAEAAGIKWAAPASSGLANIVEDTTPQLGGDLDANGNTITGLDASDTIKGIIELATQAEVDAGTDTTRAVTPDTLFGLPQSLVAAGGYQKLPGGLIVQWGKYTGGAHGPNINYPLTFPTAVFAVVGTLTGGSQGFIELSFLGQTSFTALQQRHDAGNVTDDFVWIALGY